jgi:septal ring factor EnvC (AmiA/AmiB activator)
MVHVRIVQQTRTLRLLGAQWTAASDTEREKIERRERSVATKLSKLNRNLEKRDKKALPLERDLFKLEREVANLKRIVGDASSSND